MASTSKKTVLVSSRGSEDNHPQLLVVGEEEEAVNGWEEEEDVDLEESGDENEAPPNSTDNSLISHGAAFPTVSFTASQKKKRKRRVRVIPPGLRRKRSASLLSPEASPPHKQIVEEEDQIPSPMVRQPQQPQAFTGFSILECLPAPTVQIVSATKKPPKSKARSKSTPAKAKAKAKPPPKTPKTAKKTRKSDKPPKTPAKAKPRKTKKSTEKTPALKSKGTAKSTTKARAKIPKKKTPAKSPTAGRKTPKQSRSKQKPETAPPPPKTPKSSKMVPIPSPPQAIAKAPPKKKRKMSLQIDNTNRDASGKVDATKEPTVEAPQKKVTKETNYEMPGISNAVDNGNVDTKTPTVEAPQKKAIEDSTNYELPNNRDAADKGNVDAKTPTKAAPTEDPNNETNCELPDDDIPDDLSWKEDPVGNRMKITRMKPAFGVTTRSATKAKKSKPCSTGKAVIGRGPGTATKAPRPARTEEKKFPQEKDNSTKPVTRSHRARSTLKRGNECEGKTLMGEEAARSRMEDNADESVTRPSRGATRNVDDAMVHWLRNRDSAHSEKKKGWVVSNKLDDAMNHWLRKRNQDRQQGEEEEEAGVVVSEQSANSTRQQSMEDPAEDIEDKKGEDEDVDSYSKQSKQDTTEDDEVKQSAPRIVTGTPVQHQSTEDRSEDGEGTIFVGTSEQNQSPAEVEVAKSKQATATAKALATTQSAPPPMSEQPNTMMAFKSKPKQEPRRVSFEEYQKRNITREPGLAPPIVAGTPEQQLSTEDQSEHSEEIVVWGTSEQQQSTTSETDCAMDMQTTATVTVLAATQSAPPPMSEQPNSMTAMMLQVGPPVESKPTQKPRRVSLEDYQEGSCDRGADIEPGPEAVWGRKDSTENASAVATKPNPRKDRVVSKGATKWVVSRGATKWPARSKVKANRTRRLPRNVIKRKLVLAQEEQDSQKRARNALTDDDPCWEPHHEGEGEEHDDDDVHSLDEEDESIVEIGATMAAGEVRASEKGARCAMGQANSPDKPNRKRKERSDKGKKRGPRKTTTIRDSGAGSGENPNHDESKGTVENTSSTDSEMSCKKKPDPRKPAAECNEPNLPAGDSVQAQGSPETSVLEVIPKTKPKRKPRSDKGKKRGPRKKPDVNEQTALSAVSSDMQQQDDDEIGHELATQSSIEERDDGAIVDRSNEEESALPPDGEDSKKRGPYKMTKSVRKPRSDKGQKRGTRAEMAARAGNKATRPTGNGRRIVGFYASHRCGECIGCRARNCGKCKPCMDMPEFGGAGKTLKLCILKRCLRPRGSQRAAKGKAAESTTSKEPSRNDKEDSMQMYNSDVESLQSDNDSVANAMSDMEWEDEDQSGKVLAIFRQPARSPAVAAMPPAPCTTTAAAAAADDEESEDEDNDEDLGFNLLGTSATQSGAELVRALQDRQRAEMLDMQEEEEEEDDEDSFYDPLLPPPPADYY